MKSITTGSPQVSVLGPRFLIHMNDIDKCIGNGHIAMFPENTTAVKRGENREGCGLHV